MTDLDPDLGHGNVGRMEFQLMLRKRGISDAAVLRAMDEIPRENFVEADMRPAAYADQALPIACGQTISQPYVVAYMTEQLRLRPIHRVLEIGTGSGYQTAVLSRARARSRQHRALSHAGRPRATASRPRSGSPMSKSWSATACRARPAARPSTAFW